MVTKKSITILVFAISAAVLFQSCRGYCSPIEIDLTGGTETIYPGADSVRIGDTLWVSATIPAQIKYLPGNSTDSVQYDLSGSSDVSTVISIMSLKGFSSHVGAIDSFYFFPVKGSIQTTPVTYATTFDKFVTFHLENQSYILSFFIVTRKAGVYYLSVSDIFKAQKKCNTASITIKQNNQNAHLHYLQEIYYGSQPIAQIDLLHAYCFKVY